MKGQILIGESVPSLTMMYSRVLRISTRSTTLTTQPPVSNDHFAIFSSRDRGRSRGHDLGGRHGCDGQDLNGGRGSREYNCCN